MELIKLNAPRNMINIRAFFFLFSKQIWNVISESHLKMGKCDAIMILFSHKCLTEIKKWLCIFNALLINFEASMHKFFRMFAMWYDSSHSVSLFAHSHTHTLTLASLCLSFMKRNDKLNNNHYYLDMFQIETKTTWTTNVFIIWLMCQWSLKYTYEYMLYSKNLPSFSAPTFFFFLT